MPESLLFKVANKEQQTGEIFQETLKLKLCTPSQYLIWNGISIEKTTAIKKSHKFHLVKPFIVRGVEPFLNFHGSALVVCGTNYRQMSFIPRSKDGSFTKQPISTTASGTRGSPGLLLPFWEALLYLYIRFFLKTLLQPD